MWCHRNLMIELTLLFSCRSRNGGYGKKSHLHSLTGPSTLGGSQFRSSCNEDAVMLSSLARVTSWLICGILAWRYHSEDVRLHHVVKTCCSSGRRALWNRNEMFTSWRIFRILSHTSCGGPLELCHHMSDTSDTCFCALFFKFYEVLLEILQIYYVLM